MADEPSIDEILASLDKLLKEGEGRNDEPVESASDDADEAQASPSAHDAPTPRFFMVLDDEARDAHDDAGPDEPASDAPVGEATAAGMEQADETPEAPATEAPRVFVLTEAMRIDDQQDLPLGEGHGETRSEEADEDMDPVHQALAMPESEEEPERADAAEPEIDAQLEPEAETIAAQPEPELPQPEIVDEAVPGIAAAEEFEEASGGTALMVWDETDMQALVDQVTDDVCSAIASELPDIIRRALEERLAAFMAARTGPQDTESSQ